eukprot:2104946-Pyramimonas_sp.AAC.1
MACPTLIFLAVIQNANTWCVFFFVLLHLVRAERHCLSLVSVRLAAPCSRIVSRRCALYVCPARCTVPPHCALRCMSLRGCAALRYTALHIIQCIALRPIELQALP